MSLFKLGVNSVGYALAGYLAYEAQDAVADKMKQLNESPRMIIAGRLAATFIVLAAVGSVTKNTSDFLLGN